MAKRHHLPRKGYLFAANVYLQDELRGAEKGALFAGHKVELSPQHEVALFAVNNVGALCDLEFR